MADESTYDMWKYTYGLTSTGGVALLIYEHIVTFDNEINLFWRGKLNAASILFIANRYLALLTNVGELPWIPWIDPSSSESCVTQFYLLGTIGALQYIPWAAFSALRAYVLSQQSWTAALSVFVLSAGPLVYFLVPTASLCY
ncbi:hypothetical protein C8Q74DRAFT_1250388 [Fomes fomentarius]|nr:hypothetical protein C8Q74DRAFT_1250388 [Fomes fomentarius]